MTCGIYCIAFANGKKYIGQSVNIERRLRVHRNQWHRESYPTVPLYHAMSRVHYVMGIVEECERSSLTERERYYIEYYDTRLQEGNGYNYRDGGATNNGWTGVRAPRAPFTKQHRQRISDAQRGRVLPQKTRDKIRETMKHKHFNISKWELEFSDGSVIIVTNLKQWCRDNTKYSFGTLQRMNRLGRGTNKDCVRCQRRT